MIRLRPLQWQMKGAIRIGSGQNLYASAIINFGHRNSVNYIRAKFLSLALLFFYFFLTFYILIGTMWASSPTMYENTNTMHEEPPLLILILIKVSY